jgi:GNAT superfamily N-acetyltransferase
MEVVRLVEPAQSAEVECRHPARGARRARLDNRLRVAVHRRAVQVPLLAEDLAPGDRAIAARDWSDLDVRRVAGPRDPEFELAYEELWREFGGRGEMETRRAIEERLAWDPARPVGHFALAYEMLVLRRRGTLAAVRDHTAVVRLDAKQQPRHGPVVVHLSHALVLPAERGSGLAAWLRALPLGAARRAASAAGCAPDTPFVLVAEMEPQDPAEPERMVRLRSYQRAGFKRVDPAAAPYAQPDFRSPEQLAGPTPRAIPLGLVLRRVGREEEMAIPAAELAAVVESIYAVYGVHVPAVALDPLRAAAAEWTARRPSFRLLPPTA